MRAAVWSGRTAGRRTGAAMKANATTAPSPAHGVAAPGGRALVGHAAQLCSVTSWATGLVLLQPLVAVLGFGHLVLIQMGAAALIMWPIVLALGRPVLDLRGALLRLAFGALTPGCSMLLTAAGARLTDAVSIGVIWGLFPLIVPLLGRALLGERLLAGLYVGAVVAFGGVVALVGYRQSAGEATLVGNLLVFAAVFASALGQVFGRYINRNARQPMVTAALQITGAALVAALAALILAPTLPDLRLPPRLLAELAWLILVPTVVNLLAYNVALSRLPVGWISLYVSLIPAINALLSWLYLGEAVRPWEAAAIAVIVTGVALPSIERARRFGAAEASSAKGGTAR
jgi:drug/metabolite transporter (DMT)-like permease